jgi:hypothetical protein
MKNNVTDGLNEVLDIDSELVEVPLKRKKVEVPTDAQDDYQYARKNLYDVIDKGNEALDYLLELAKASEHPRAFEVVGQITKTLVDANNNLLDLQKKIKDLSKDEDKPQNVTNALFVGSTVELQKLLKGQDE